MSIAADSSSAAGSTGGGNSNSSSSISASTPNSASNAGSNAGSSSTNTSISKRSDKQFDGAAFLSTLAMAVFELGITLTASYLFSKWIAKLMVKNNHTGGEDEADSGLNSPGDSAVGTGGGGGSNGVVAKLKRLLDARQESTLSAMMEELDEEGDDFDHDYNYNHGNDSGHNNVTTEIDKCRRQQVEEKKEDHCKDGRQSYDKNTIEMDQNEYSDAKDKQLQQRQYHIQRLQTELQSRHISSLQSLNYLSPYELSIARNNLVDPADIAVSFGDVGGMDDIKSEIYDLVVLPLLRPDLFDCESGLVSPPKGILLYGPPGTGKTMLAKAIAKESHATFINVQLSTIMNKWFGESNKLISATFHLARKLAPSVVFIDEIDSFLSLRDSTEGSSVASMKSEFLTLWDGLLSEKRRGGAVVGGKMVTNDADDGRRRRGFSLFGKREEDITNDDNSALFDDNHSPLLPTPAVIVLGATNRPYDVDPAILRRLPRSFEIPLPRVISRLQLLQLFLEKQNMTKEAKEYLPELAKRTEGYSGSDLKEVCRAAAWEPVREMTTGASRRAVGVSSIDSVTNSMNGGSRTTTPPLLKRSSSGFPPRGAKARPVNVSDFTLALQKVKRTGESARQFHAKEFVRRREDQASMAADISKAAANGKGKKATTKSGGRNGTHSQHGNRATSNDVSNIDIQQLMAMAMAAASSINLGNTNADGNPPTSLYQGEEDDDEDNQPEMSDSSGN